MSPSRERARVFFALWPDMDVRDSLAGVAQECKLECGGRRTPAEKLHITLFFVGDVERATVPRLQSIAGAMSAASFRLDVTELGLWRHNRIVWAGSKSAPPALATLVSDLTRGLAAVGVRSEDRPYVPHVTLLRNARAAPGHTRIAPIAWHAHEFVLVESVAAGGASRYEVIARWPFSGQAEDADFV
ncbi:MAG TPA: RNA 2',3'-cyclic phosphodiesterase [Burkholderiales bacterium]|nr:RNA 2',3'-cyclic phosphodiesterase [Burkholderiales bacterium]